MADVTKEIVLRDLTRESEMGGVKPKGSQTENPRHCGMRIHCVSCVTCRACVRASDVARDSSMTRWRV